MTEPIELELLQPSVCLTAGGPATVLLRVRNTSTQTVGFTLEVQGRLNDSAAVEPAEMRLDPGESRLARVRFQPGDGASVPAGPMPYAIAAVAVSDGAQLTAAFGLVDIHRQETRATGTAVPRARTA